MNQSDTATLDSWGPRETWNIGWHLKQQAANIPDQPFLKIEQGETDSFREAYEHAARIASPLSRVGVNPGDFVLFMTPTSKDSIYSWFAAKLLGAIDVPLNTAYRGQTLIHGVNLSTARVLIVDVALLPRIYEVASSLHTLETVVVLGAPTTVPTPRETPRFRVVPLSELPPSQDWSPATPKHSDISTVLYTSGTTGPAKGVLMSNAQTYTIARQCIEGLRITGDDVFYCFHPLFHMAGRFGAVYSALVTGCLIVLDTTFDPVTWIERVREYGATVSIAHGPMIEMIHARPPRPDDSDNPMRAILAAPLPSAIGAQFEERFGVLALETWGMTEVTACCWRPYDSELRLGSAGRPRSDLVEIVIVDPETDDVLPANEVGEITVRPLHPWIIMQGYLGMPDKTLEAWRNFRFHSGDAGYLDEEGFLFFVDRMGDRIRRKAENISSYDIEWVASRYPGVVECAAVGVPISESDDEVKLCLQHQDGHELDLVHFFSYLVANLPHSMVPRYIEIVDALPRTPTNKIQKQLLRQQGVTTTTWDYKDAGLSVREISEKGDTTMSLSGRGVDHD